MSSAPSRRRYPRQLRRLAVRFWRQGEDRARQGFTKNLSLTGAFVSTPDPAARGERLRLELSDAGRSALLDAVVVHSHRVPPEFRRFADSAMGLRFLALDELVGPFLGKEALQPESGEAAGGRAGEGTGASAAGGGVAAAAGSGARSEAPEGGEGRGERAGASPGGAEEAPDGSDPARAAGIGGAGGGAAGVGAAGVSAAGVSATGSGAASIGTGAPAAASAAERDPSATGSPLLPTGGPAAAYSLRFATGNDFLATYRRDLLNGGLFVTTDRPARLHERVAVDLHLPGASAPTIRIEGRVVQVVDPRPLASGRTAGGMGLELVDPDAAIARLAPHVAAYER